MMLLEHQVDKILRQHLSTALKYINFLHTNLDHGLQASR